jgi:penicillin amidase
VETLLRRPWFLTLGACVVLVVAVTLAMGLVRLQAAASRLPDRGTSSERVAGCPAPVEVVFDQRGIAHLRADDDRALWFVHGYLHARDRFYQMEYSRRLAAGRLAEVFGASALDLDRKMRTWRLTASARRQLVQLSTAERRALVSYADGVNAALDRYGRWIAPEIWMLARSPERWMPEDSLRIGMLLQLSLSWAMGNELERAVQLARLGRDRAVDLWGWSPREARAWIPPGEPVSDPQRDDDAIVPPIRIMGSNGWAVAPFRSATGRPLLANDPHLGVQMPGIWCAVHLRCPGLHVAGLSLPGVPGVLVGHTERVAWGLTNAMVDDQDLYEITLDETGNRELIDGSWQALRTVTERIRVRWQSEPVLEKIRLSEHGPLVREDRRQVLALSWTGLEGPNPLRAVLGMDRARTVQEVAAAWKDVLGPSMTLVAADVEGHILRQMVGAAPRRGRGAGRLPAPGADSSWAWRGIQALDSRLADFDPSEGFVATANHDPFSEGDLTSSLAVPGEYDAPWRVRRIRRALAGRQDWNVSRSLELQGEVVSELALVTLKQLWADLEENNGATAARLLEWDGRMEAGAVPPHLFVRLMLELRSEIGGDEAERDGLDTSPIGGSEIIRLLAGGLDEAWWDDVRTADSEGRSEIMARVLDRIDGLGLNAEWGQVHQVYFAHPFAQIPVLGRFLGKSWSRGPFPVAGDSVTINAHYWNVENLVLPPGQSGRPWSIHYADQVDPWLHLAGPTFPFSDEAVEAAAAARLIIEPVIEREE